MAVAVLVLAFGLALSYSASEYRGWGGVVMGSLHLAAIVGLAAIAVLG